MNRESWLCKAFDLIQPYLKEAGYEPPKVNITCGWPSRGGLSATRRVRGECWWASASKEGRNHIFISPLDDDPREVLGVLVHELLHAALPEGMGHKGDFPKACKKVGLIGKPTSTSPGVELAIQIQIWVDTLGPYPHHGLLEILKDAGDKKDGTRMLKLVCRANADHPEDYIVRASRKVISIGLPMCPCGKEMREDTGGGGEAA